MPWTSLWRGHLNGILQPVWGVPRSKRLARDGAIYALFALFFYMQSECKSAYAICSINIILCLIATLCVNLILKIPKYLPLALSVIEMAGFSYYAVANGHNDIAYVIGIFAPNYILVVIFDVVPN